MRVFTRGDARERPRFNGVAGRECIPASKESNALPLYLRPWSLRDKLQHIHRDIGIDQSLDPNAAGIPRAWIVTCFPRRSSEYPANEGVFRALQALVDSPLVYLECPVCFASPGRFVPPALWRERLQMQE